MRKQVIWVPQGTGTAIRRPYVSFLSPMEPSVDHIHSKCHLFQVIKLAANQQYQQNKMVAALTSRLGLLT